MDLSGTTEQERLGEKTLTVLGLETGSRATKSLETEFEAKGCGRCFGEQKFISSGAELISCSSMC